MNTDRRRHLGRIMLWFALLLCGSTAWAGAAPDNILPVGQDSISVRFESLADVDERLTLQQLLDPEAVLQWNPVAVNYTNFGYQNYPSWYRFRVSNDTFKQASYALEIAFPLLDSIRYIEMSDGEIVQVIETGDSLPYRNRAFDHPYFIFPLTLDSGTEKTIYLRVKTEGAHTVPVTLWQDKALYVKLSKENELHAIYFGIVSVIIFFNVLIFIALREKMYLYYALSTLMFLFFFAIMRGKLFPLFFPDSPELYGYCLPLVIPACLLFAALFTREFLSLKNYGWFPDAICRGVAAAGLFCMVSVLFLDRITSVQISVAVAVPCTFLLLLLGPMLILMGNRMAWVYTAAWSVLMFGATVGALSKQGVLPVNFMTEFSMQIGSALEAFILNAALAFRFYREHKDRISAQQARLQENADRREAELRLLQASMSEPVTLMPNRLCFEQQITLVLAKRQEQRIAVCVIELNRFAEIKRSLGHHNTDLIMRKVAQDMNGWFERLPGLIRIEGPTITASLCALEQGAFGVLMYADPAESNYMLVSEVVRQLMRPIDYNGMRLALNPVFGIAVCPEHGLNAPTLLRNAQIAADSSEAHEKTLAYYRTEIDQSNAKRLTLISELREAIRDDVLELYYQPKWDFKKNRVVCVEALLRWQHPRFGMVRPDEFVALAEQTGIIRPLTRWVVRNALASLKRFQNAGFELGMSINISALNLHEADLSHYVQAFIGEFGLDARDVYLELTETSMMQDAGNAITKLDNIRKTGIKVSVDDFGSGFSSLSYLRLLPADEIKIDRSLTAYIATETQGEVIVRKSIEMCHALGFEVVAEGVETKEMMDMLYEMGCDQVQGYGISPPLPFDELLYWLRHRAELGSF